MIAGGSVEVGPEASESVWHEAEEKFITDFLSSLGRDPLERSWPFRD